MMRGIILSIGCSLAVLLGGCDIGPMGPIFSEGNSGTDYNIDPDFTRWEGNWRFMLTEPFPTATEDTSIVTFDSRGTGRGSLDLEVGNDFSPFVLTLQITSSGYLQNPSRCLNSESENGEVRILHSRFWMSGRFAPADTNQGTYTVQYCLSSAPSDTVFDRGNWTAYRQE